MNNKQYDKIEEHYKYLVKNGTIKTMNEGYVYKLAIDKAFSLSDVGGSILGGKIKRGKKTIKFGEYFYGETTLNGVQKVIREKYPNWKLVKIRFS